MALEIDKVEVSDLVRELSPDAIRYFAEMELSDEWSTDETALSGKFVRLGEIILLGTTIEFGPVYRGHRNSLIHMNMLGHGFNGMGEDIVERIKAGAPEDAEYLKGRWPLVDAGGSIIRTYKDGQPVNLSLYGNSYDFGRGTEQVRQRTGEIAQSVLGTDFTVSAE
jgi:hypothetical protein